MSTIEKPKRGVKYVLLLFTSSNSTTETVEKGVKYVRSLQQKHQSNLNDVVLAFLLLVLNIFQTFSYCFLTGFSTNHFWEYEYQQVNLH